MGGRISRLHAQHTANGLRYGIDNWRHHADANTRHRWVQGALIEETTARRGQFGVSFDETGRFLTCHQNSVLHADLIPSECMGRNPHLTPLLSKSGWGVTGVDINLANEAQQVYPIRVTPGITLGALELRDDGRLRTYTIASGVCYYDGDQFPADVYHGITEHAIFMVPWISDQVRDRQLETGRDRIRRRRGVIRRRNVFCWA